MALLAGCADDEPLPVGSRSGSVIEACIDGDYTRTSLNGSDEDGYDVLWSAGDEIGLIYKYGRQSSYLGFSRYLLSGGAGTSKASFIALEDFISDTAEPVCAIYPASIISQELKGKTSSYIHHLSWPSQQEYVEGNVTGAPMFASVDDLEEPVMFRNLGGLLRLTVKGSAEVTSITLTADQAIAGDFEIYSIDNPAVKFTDSAVHSISLDCGDGVQLDQDGVDFYFSLPEGSYSGVQMKFFDADGECSTKTAGGTIVISRSQITAAKMDGIRPSTFGTLVKVTREWDVTQNDIISSLSSLLSGSSIQGMGALLGMIVKNGAHLAAIEYLTEGPDGSTVTASGTVIYPQVSDTVVFSRIVSFQHGTCDMADAPSLQTIATELVPCAVGKNMDPTTPILFMSTAFREWYVGCMADYLGYGVSQTSDRQHPYLHVGLTGTTCADMLKAAEEYIAQKNLDIAVNKSTGSPDIDLVGYSQGGAATLATLLELQRRGGYTNRIHEVWAGAGPYDIPEFLNYFKSQTSYMRTGYIPFCFRGICYGEGVDLNWANIYTDAEKANYIESICSTREVGDLTGLLGNDVTGILNGDFYAEGFNANPDILSLFSVLQKNSLTACKKPAASLIPKIKLYHSKNDNTVPYACSENLREAWGCSAVNELTPADHVEAGVSFLLEYCGIGGLL